MNKQLAQTLEKIARDHFSVETLETRNGDSLDFHDCAVWEIRAALLAAYEAGRADEQKRTARTTLSAQQD